MTQFLREIFAPQIQFEGRDLSDKFLKYFSDLYRIELFKDGLDLILTKLQEKDLNFEVKIIKGWDTNVGCYLTEQNKIFNKITGTFSAKVKKTIILRQLNYSVLSHEMAHALEFESGINLGEEFRQAIGFDMKGRNPENIALKGEIKRLMVDALKSYPSNQFISELFARYFELLSVSRNVCENGSFTTSDVMTFFQNTTNFIERKFNPIIKTKINQKIAGYTIEIAQQVKVLEPKQQFQEKVDSFHQKTDSNNKVSWTKNTKSNAMWQSAWNKYKELEDKK